MSYDELHHINVRCIYKDGESEATTSEFKGRTRLQKEEDAKLQYKIMVLRTGLQSLNMHYFLDRSIICDEK